MMQRELVEQALVESRALQARYPDVETIASVICQLEHLLAPENGESDDQARPGDIILGVQAAREIEPLDMLLADKLHAINAEVARSKRASER